MNLSKPRRQRQRVRRQTKGLMSGTILVHVRYQCTFRWCSLQNSNVK